MHCANLDTPVKGAVQLSPQRLSQLQQNTETKEEENLRILETVLDAGILILEGRLPEPSSKRSYVEGPHCVFYPQTQAHQCDPNRYMCKRAENYKHLISSLWNECKGICIELRVCADCNCGQEQVWQNTSSSFDYILEQWYFEPTNVRNEEEDLGIMNLYGLMQAIRSQIHFSQLSAWWSSNQAQLPKNITYHVLPLIQADVNSCSLQHKFPVLSFTTTYLQVKLRSQPRSETLPYVHCPVHCNKEDVVDDRMKISCDRLGKHHCQAVEDLDENDNETWCDKHTCVQVLDKPEPNVVREIPENSCSDLIVRSHKKNYKKNTKKCPSSVSETQDLKRNGIVKIRHANTRTDTKNEPRINMHRNGCYGSNSIFILPNRINLSNEEDTERKLMYIPKPNYFSINQASDKTKFDLSTGRLAGETTTQFFNICNWTNTMVSSVVSKMRNGNSFLNNFPDPNTLSDFFTFNKTEGDKPESKNEAIDVRVDNNESANGRTHVEIDSSSNGNAEQIDSEKQQSEYTNAITTTFACGDTNSKITSLSKPLHPIPSDNTSIRMNCSSEEMKKNAFRGGYRPVALQEKNFEEFKLKSFHEKRFHFENSASRKRLLPFAGNVIESVLSGRVHFTNYIENFKIKVTSGGSFSMQNCTDLPAAAYYYHFGDGILSKSYLVKSFIPENEKGIQIPNCGRLQVGIFNTEESLIKVFTVSYDLSDMPRCSKTFLRHSNYFTPKCANENDVKWLQSFLQLKCRCSKSGRLYLQSEINAIMFQKSDLNTACEFKMKTDLMHQDITEIAYKKDTPIQM